MFLIQGAEKTILAKIDLCFPLLCSDRCLTLSSFFRMGYTSIVSYKPIDSIGICIRIKAFRYNQETLIVKNKSNHFIFTFSGRISILCFESGSN